MVSSNHLVPVHGHVQFYVVHIYEHENEEYTHVYLSLLVRHHMYQLCINKQPTAMNIFWKIN